jgi:DNA-binding MarR family transcriptional regulator
MGKDQLGLWFSNPERVDLLRMRSGLLRVQERAILEMVFRAGYRPTHIARAMGLHPSNVSRRITKIVRRLAGGEYLACLRRWERFSEVELSMAREYYLRGRSMNAIAAKLGLSRYGVRRLLASLEAKRKQIAAEGEKADRRSSWGSWSKPQ